MSGSRGFTLIEIMVAILVLSIAVLGLASVLAGTSRRQERSVSHAELAAAAESKFEDLRSMAASGTDTLQLVIGGSLTQDVTDHADTLATTYGRAIRRRWLVADGPAGTRAVTVRVQPDDEARNDYGALTFRTLVVAP